MKRLPFFIFYFALVIALGAAQALPKATGRVNDFANVIDPAAQAEIDHMIAQLEDGTSAEIAVATVSSLDGMSVEEYANRLFKEWGVGQAKQDNGVLVLVAPSERKMRVEVGYGLEGVLPDGLAGEVIRDEFTPRFRDNDYSGGIKNGVTRLVNIVQAHRVLDAAELARFNSSNNSGSPNDMPTFIAVPFFCLFIGIGFGMLGVGLRSKVGFPVIFGSLFGGLPLLGSLAVLKSLAWITTFPFAIFMLIAGHRVARKPKWGDAFRNGKHRKGGSSGGWTMGGGSSSGGSSSSSSSSSSFGGGSSGGGGASGSW